MLWWIKIADLMQFQIARTTQSNIIFRWFKELINNKKKMFLANVQYIVLSLFQSQVSFDAANIILLHENG